MATVALTTADRVYIVQSLQQLTGVAVEAIEAGAAVRIDTTTGKWTNANGSSAGEARVIGIATRSVAAGEALTVLKKGILDGFALASQAYDLPIYMSDTDATLDDGTGSTVDVAVGRVIPAFATTLGTAADKLLLVDL